VTGSLIPQDSDGPRRAVRDPLGDVVEQAPSDGSLRSLLIAGLGARLLVDTSNQLFNPFLSVFAHGLGVSVVALGVLVSVRSVAGLSGPLLGAWADRVGYLKAMRVSVALIVIGMVAFGLADTLIVAGLAMLPMGVGLASFTPALQAYLSARISYEERGRGLGILEYAWALAGIVGLSLAGGTIALVGWRAPFFAVAATLLIVLIGSFWFRPAVTPRAANDEAEPATLQGFFRLGGASPSAWASIVVVGLTFFAMMNVIIIHSEWLQASFGLGAGQLGLVALLLGLCDLAGSVLVSVLADRFGKRRLVLIGTALCLFGYLLLPALQAKLALTLLGLGLVRFLMQVAYVSNIPLLSEQVPLQRGKVMALGFAMGQLGLVIAGISGPWTYLRFGVAGLSMVSGAAMILTLVIVLLWVRETPGQVPYSARLEVR